MVAVTFYLILGPYRCFKKILFFLGSGVYVGVKVNVCVQNVIPLKYGFILYIYNFRASKMAK